MSRSAEIGVRKPDNRGVCILIARAIFVGFWVVISIGFVHSLHIRLRTQLHHSKRRGRPGKGVAHSVRADKWIYKLCEIFRLREGVYATENCECEN